MMLHKRLKEWGGKGKCTHSVIKAEDYYGVHWAGEAFDAMADEIERTYIPKHTDVKGDPWCEGDECEVIFSGRYGLISGYRSDQVLVSFPDGDVWYYPYEIRRIEPDTLERINDDASMNPREYYKKHIGAYASIRDDEHVITAFARDLLKRQREVLERGE